MSGKYYIARTLAGAEFDDAVARTMDALGTEGFGVLSDIDVAATLKKKLGEEMRPYRILGACNPALAHKALSAEDKIGVMLPCNVIVQAVDGGVEVAAVNPEVAMARVDNPALAPLAEEVRSRLRRVIDAL
ncbi:MAG: DUF302 domain-containing protein [Rhodobacteraceae bacterium]|nr:DUF302 domain-containing protein [Paracoccaceae bacterium]MCP5341786.1 DUF302 domain-containing protein [Paracoccaceae bacterium]